MARQRKKASKATKRAFKPLPVKTKKVDDGGAARPTDEMLTRVEYEFGPVKTEMNIQVGAAYRRRPLYLTMAKKHGRFTLDQLSALQDYRSIHDRCERSPFRSCLADTQGGGGRGIGPASFIHASPAVTEAKRKLAMIEQGLGIYLATMRAVVLDDQSFSRIAMDRFGCRRQSWIRVDKPVLTNNGVPVLVDGKPVLRGAHEEKIVPRSGRDREKIAAEFERGLRLLAKAVQRLGGADVSELWVQPRDDGTAVIHRASTAPNGLFRMWGRSQVVAQVVDDLLDRNGGHLVFASPEAARDLLLEVDAGRLHHLLPDELAA